MKRELIQLTGIALIITALFTSCEVVKNLIDIKFETGYTEISFPIEPSSAGPIVFSESYIKSELEQEIKDNGGNIDNLRNVRVSDISLEIVSGEPNLNALDYVDVYVSSTNHTAILIGSVKNISDGLTWVDLVATEEELKSILSDDEYLVEIKGALDGDLKEKTEFLLKVNYSVVVGP